jgi:hypothetical protein
MHAGYIVWFGSDAVLPKSARFWLSRILGFNCDGLIPAFSNLDRYPFWAGFTILFGLEWVCILLATLLTRPEPRETLEKFYRMAKPIGFWGPVRRGLSPAHQRTVHINVPRIILSCALGIIFYFSITLSLFGLTGGHVRLAIVCLCTGVVSEILFAKTAILRLKSEEFLAPMLRGVETQS